MYNASKPEKWHFKIFALNDSAAGYMSNFYLYHGKEEDRPPEIAATMYPITQLLTKNYHHKNHILYTDNWYTSIPVLTYVRSKGCHLVGTIKANKKGLPRDAIFSDSGPHKKQRGDMLQMKFVVDTHDVYFISWMDKKPVHLLSSLQSYKTECKRATIDVNKNFARANFSQPSIIKQYNKGMGGTDSFDQRLSMFRPKLKTLS